MGAGSPKQDNLARLSRWSPRDRVASLPPEVRTTDPSLTKSRVLEWRHQGNALVDYSDQSVSSESCCISGFAANWAGIASRRSKLTRRRLWPRCKAGFACPSGRADAVDHRRYRLLPGTRKADSRRSQGTRDQRRSGRRTLARGSSGKQLCLYGGDTDTKGKDDLVRAGQREGL
jgi:hypothetical protein